MENMREVFELLSTLTRQEATSLAPPPPATNR